MRRVGVGAGEEFVEPMLRARNRVFGHAQANPPESWCTDRDQQALRGFPACLEVPDAALDQVLARWQSVVLAGIHAGIIAPMGPTRPAPAAGDVSQVIVN